MTDTLIFCGQGYSNSLFVSLGLAMASKLQGADVAVFFSQGAMVAFAEERFEPAPLLSPYAEAMAEEMKKLGFSADPVEMLKMAKGAGVTIYGCGTSARSFGIADRLPPEMELLEMGDPHSPLMEAKKVITIAL